MHSQRYGDEARRRFWAEQMDEAYLFMQKMALQPVSESGEEMIPLPETAGAAGVEIIFSKTPAPGGAQRLFYVRRGLGAKVLAVAREMNRRGWTLRIEDAYRTVEVQKRLAVQESVFDAILARTLWELKGRPPTVQEMLRRVSALVATCPKVGTHMSGSALDISVLRRDDGMEVDRGAPYLEMSELTPMDSPFALAEARENRKEITALMARHGFAAYPYEFWHYSSGDAYSAFLSGIAEPAGYGPVRMELPGGRTCAIPNPIQPLHTEEEIRCQIELSLNRLARKR